MVGGQNHKSGVSRKVRKVIGDPGRSDPHNHSGMRGVATPLAVSLGPTALVQARLEAEQRGKDYLQGMSPQGRAILREIQAESQSYTVDEGYIMDNPTMEERQDDEMDWEDELGGDDDTEFVYALRDIIGSRQRELHAWDPLIEPLADAYLAWNTEQNANLDAEGPATAAANARSSRHTTNSSSPEATTFEYGVVVFDIYTLQSELKVNRSPESISPAIDLAAHGFLAKTPTTPQVAVSFKTLQLLYRIRQRKPSFSIEAFTKVICDYYAIPFRRYLRSIFGDTFEVYLRILRQVEKRVFVALGWDTPDWRALNACTACSYKLKDEPPLVFSRIYAVDGNDSLKRMIQVGDRKVADDRVFEEGDYFLSRAFVDQYANEVRARKPRPVMKGAQDSDVDSEDEEFIQTQTSASAAVNGEEGDPTDGNSSRELRSCVDNWKAAAAEEKKKMWGVFDETGVVVGACQHGLILWAADMIKSGELAKYPLAIVSKCISLFDPGSLGGYDIGCSFAETIKNSSLGEAFARHGGRMCVNAFHGYTHCYQCQLKNHPNVITGVGLEDLETLERVFSATNQLASVTRYASPYRRRLFIETYFKQWDDEKYQNLGTFLLNNYKQALDILERDSRAFNEALQTMGLDEAEMEGWEEEEGRFFATLGKEDEADVRAIAYVQLLQELRSLEAQKSSADTCYINSMPAEFIAYSSGGEHAAYAKQAAATRRLETKRRVALERYDSVLHLVVDMELRMNITHRWTPTTPAYIEASKYIKERVYHKALDKLQKLVIQRLFELHKLNISQTGYKMRTHLAKSLQTRCKTIRSAVAAYNTAAAALNPPRPPLDWTQVSHYAFLEEFNLLSDTRNDIRDKPWGKPAIRETMKLRRRIMRAKEEIIRCNVQVRRLHTAIRDERILFKTVLSRLKAEHDPVYTAVKEFATHRLHINEQLLQRIYQVHALPGFTGIKSPGTRLGSDAGPESPDSTMPLPSGGAAGDEDDDDEGMGAAADDEDTQEDIGNLLHFLSQLAI